MLLQDLPVETIIRIFAFLDYRDLLTISSLSHFFRDVYESSPELQYSCALQVSGMVDSDPTLDKRHKLEELERRERAWRTMDLSRKATVRVPHRTSHIYDLSGGVYLLGDCKDSIISRDTHTLRFFDLTTCSSGKKLFTDPWPEMVIDGNIVDIGFGLNEFDLVAVVGIRPGKNGEPGQIILSFRELSTGAPHPLAKNPDVVVDPVINGQGKLSIMLEVVGPRLLLLLTWHRGLQRFHAHDLDKLILFDWWEGRKVLTETAPPSSWNGFVFLSPDLALLPHHGRGLEIIRLPDVTKGFSSKGFERVLRLELPKQHPLVKIGAIQCRSEPNPVGEPHPSMVDGAPDTDFARRIRTRRRPPVAPDPTKAVVLLQIYYREFNNEPHDILMGQWGVLRHNVSLVVHREFLLKLVDKSLNKTRPPSPTFSTNSFSGLSTTAISSTSAPAGANEDSDDMDFEEFSSSDGTDTPMREPSVPTIAWSDWSRAARWMADDTHVSNWITTSAGQRYVGADEEGHIVVKDFNPATVKRVRAAIRAAVTRSEDKDDAFDERRGEKHWISDAWEKDGSRSHAGTAPFAENSAGLELMLMLDVASSPAPEPPSGLEAGSDAGQNNHQNHVGKAEETPASPDGHEASGSRLPSSDPASVLTNAREALAWRSIRLIEGYNEIEDIELRQLFSEVCKWPLPCVQYVSRRTYEYHGLLMDEERIIGLRHDERTGAIVEFDVFTL